MRLSFLLTPASAALLSLGLALTSPPLRADPPPAAEQALAASEAALAVGNDGLAENWLSRVPPGSLTLPQMARMQLVRASILLRRGQPGAALQSLPSGSAHVPQQAEQIESLRADTLFRLGDPVAAVRSLVQREAYLHNSAAAIADNRDRIWTGLLRSPPAAADVARFAIQDSMTRGWLELFQTWRQGSRADYAGWTARYPGHPGQARAASLRAATPAAATGGTTVPGPAPAAVIATPGPAVVTATAAALPASGNLNPAPLQLSAGSGRGYALLAPLSGPLAATGEALRSGFVAAAQQAGAAGLVRVYDSGGDSSQAIGAYQSALSEGAGVIVGPLHKSGVSAIARLGSPGVPLLALNTLDAGQPAPANFLQFGLAPEDEARAAARTALEQGRMRALALVPRSDWGSRVLAAFREQYAAGGGTLLAAESFDSGAPDPSRLVKRLVNLDASESRHKALTATLGKETEFDARRRNDVDVIFVAAKPSDASLLLPQLRFFRASNLPIVSTSLIYEGRAVEWQRVSVCDMPWMLEPQGRWAQARSEALSQNPAAMRDYPRLVALGGDAFRIASHLIDATLVTGNRLDGASGQLVVGGDGRIVRELGCSTPGGLGLAGSAAGAP